MNLELQWSLPVKDTLDIKKIQLDWIIIDFPNQFSIPINGPYSAINQDGGFF